MAEEETKTKCQFSVISLARIEKEPLQSFAGIVNEIQEFIRDARKEGVFPIKDIIIEKSIRKDSVAVVYCLKKSE